MNPVVQLTISVAVVVIAARMWPPLLYWLVVFFFVIGTIKGIRRLVRWARKYIHTIGMRNTLCFLLVPIAWLAIATMADILRPNQISAVSIVLCFICASIVIALLVCAPGWCRRYLHRR